MRKIGIILGMIVTILCVVIGEFFGYIGRSFCKLAKYLFCKKPRISSIKEAA